MTDRQLTKGRAHYTVHAYYRALQHGVDGAAYRASDVIIAELTSCVWLCGN